MTKQIRVNAEYGYKGDYNKLDEWQQKAHPYTVTLKYDKKQMTVPFFMGSALTHEPTDEDIVPCLVLDYNAYATSSDFEEWASHYGYDTDSRQAEKIYKQVVRQSKKLEKLFGDDLQTIIEKYEEI